MEKLFLKKAILTFAFFGSFVEPSMAEEKTETIAERWSPDCENAKGIIIYKNKTAEVEINFNQIYIRANLKIESNVINMFFKEISDLGSGGMRLDWENFSKKIPIAQIRSFSKQSFNVQWIGFYNEIDKKTYWSTNPDFVVDRNFLFYRCSNEVNK